MVASQNPKNRIAFMGVVLVHIGEQEKRTWPVKRAQLFDFNALWRA